MTRLRITAYPGQAFFRASTVFPCSTLIWEKLAYSPTTDASGTVKASVSYSRPHRVQGLRNLWNWARPADDYSSSVCSCRLSYCTRVSL